MLCLRMGGRDFVRRMLKAPPLIPRTYISQSSKIGLKGALICSKYVLKSSKIRKRSTTLFRTNIVIIVLGATLPFKSHTNLDHTDQHEGRLHPPK